MNMPVPAEADHRAVLALGGAPALNDNTTTKYDICDKIEKMRLRDYSNIENTSNEFNEHWLTFCGLAGTCGFPEVSGLPPLSSPPSLRPTHQP